jgi:DNA-directed RNA polymerase specialized sigma24 family protein
LNNKRTEAAFLELYQRHQGPVFRYALHMSGRVETAEEIVQEVFLSLLSASNGFIEASGNLQAAFASNAILSKTSRLLLALSCLRP